MIIIMVFFVGIMVVFFWRSLYKLCKALNSNHKIGDGDCIILMVVAFMSAVAAFVGIIDIVQQIVLFVGSLF